MRKTSHLLSHYLHALTHSLSFPSPTQVVQAHTLTPVRCSVREVAGREACRGGDGVVGERLKDRTDLEGQAGVDITPVGYIRLQLFPAKLLPITVRVDITFSD